MVMDFVPSLCFFPRHKASLHGFTCAAKARAVIPVLRKFTVARLLEPRCMWIRFAGAHLFEGGQLDNIEPKSYSPGLHFSHSTQIRLNSPGFPPRQKDFQGKTSFRMQL
jgi:hypothetical protein